MGLLAHFDGATYALLIAGLAVGAVLVGAAALHRRQFALRLLPRWASGRGRARPQPREAESLAGALAEFERVTSDVAVALERRARSLEALLRAADERARRLERLLSRVEARPSAERASGEVRPAVAPAATLAVRSSAKDNDARGVGAGAVPPGLASQPAAAGSRVAGLAQRVERLVRAGRTAAEIAERLRLPEGEVEFLIGLRSLDEHASASIGDGGRPDG
ncbi:MAG: hypothetical protein LC135_12825 [Phycisphaerae bacterium]|jgi:hypothetical protein|nr:hypothetical protein [Phycisphaerae bacterium]MCZ2400735.1 hypothetical protein [Phycisphaerae bacterium]